MSYVSGGKPVRRDYFWGVIGSLFAASALVIIYSLVVPKTRLDREFDALHPAVKDILLIIKPEFPDDYAILRTRVSDARRVRATKEQIDIVIFNSLRDLMYEHGKDMAVAPSANLKEVRDRNLIMIQTAQRQSPEVCAVLVSSRDYPGQTPSEDVVVAGNRGTEAAFKAIVAGRRTPTVRTPATAGDADLWRKALRQAGMTEHQFSLLQHPEQMASAPPQEVCAMGVMLKQTLAGLPADVADRLLVNNPRQATGNARPAAPKITPREMPPPGHAGDEQ